jgi:pSer/pThr/pTyr-binding forkhead associated (FHA) protein
MARLEVVAGRAVGMWILLDDELLIGRHAEGAGRLADDDEISRSHARISLDRSGFCAIEDLGSTNGTFVNGLRISGPQTIAVGDTIEVGGTTLVVRELPVPATDRPAQPAAPQPTLVPGSPAAAPTASPSQETPALALGPSGRPQRSARPPERPSAQTPAHRPTAAEKPSPGAQPPTPDAPTTRSDHGEPTAPPPAVSLTVHIDFAAREATLALEDTPPLRLRFDGDSWRPA